MIAHWFEVLLTTARRGEPAGDAGPVTFRSADDIHVAPAIEGVEAMSIHRRREEPVIVVTAYFGRAAARLADLVELLGPPRHLPPPPDAAGVELAWPALAAWELPAGSEITATVGSDGFVHRVALARILAE